MQKLPDFLSCVKYTPNLSSCNPGEESNDRRNQSEEPQCQKKGKCFEGISDDFNPDKEHDK